MSDWTHTLIKKIKSKDHFTTEFYRCGSFYNHMDCPLVVIKKNAGWIYFRSQTEATSNSYAASIFVTYLCLHQTHILQWPSYHASQGEYMPLVILPKQQTHYWWGHQTKSRCTCNVSRELECSLGVTTKDDAKFEGVSNTSCVGPSAWYTVLPLWRLLWESELLIGWSSPAKKGRKKTCWCQIWTCCAHHRLCKHIFFILN